MTKPITPSEVGAAKSVIIPNAVFDAFNAAIALAFTDGVARVSQRTVVDKLVSGGMDRNDIFSMGYLNIEAAYSAAGWKVEYDKPGYNETGEAFFYFST